MSPQPHEGTAAEGLSSTLLPFVYGEQQIAQLRDGLSAFSHRCRNLLNGMKMSLYFLRKGAGRPLPPWWAEVEDGYRGLESLFDTLQRIYRPMPLVTIRASFGSLVRDRQKVWREWVEVGGRRLEIVAPADEIAGDIDPICLGMALDAFVHWRAGALAPGGLARLGWELADGHCVVHWEESSPGEPRGRPLAHMQARPASATACIDALSLPLLARVMTAHRGTFRHVRHPTFRVGLCLPVRAAVPAASAPGPTHLAACRRT